MTDNPLHTLVQRASDTARQTAGSLAAMPTRRKILLGGGTAAGAVAIAALAAGSPSEPNFKMAARKAGKGEAQPIGDGYVLLDGWVLRDDEVPKR